MSGTLTLSEVVDTLEDKAREHKQAQNTKYHVSVAQHNISEINSELDELEGGLHELQYYKTVLEEAFDNPAPPRVNSAVEKAENAVEVSQEDLLENVQSGDMGGDEIDLDDNKKDPKVELTSKVKEHLDKIRSAKKEVEDVTDEIQNELKSEREDWITKVDAAEELQKILGGQNSDFAETLSHMRQLLTQSLMDPGGDASDFIFKWENTTGNWESHQSLQSFDDFQERHNLSDSTIEDVKTLSKSQQLTLADVSLDSLEELKRVDGLESAVELSL